MILKSMREKVEDNNDILFKNTYERYFDNLFLFAKSILKSPDRAEDVVSEVFLNLWKNRASLDTIKELSAYLFVAVKNTALRSLAQDPQKFSIQDYQESTKYADKIDPSELLIEAELQQLIHNIVEQLPDQCQLVFKMAKEQEMSYQEIAEELGISINTVKGHLKKAIQRLRSGLEAFYNKQDDKGRSIVMNVMLTL